MHYEPISAINPCHCRPVPDHLHVPAQPLCLICWVLEPAVVCVAKVHTTMVIEKIGKAEQAATAAVTMDGEYAVQHIHSINSKTNAVQLPAAGLSKAGWLSWISIKAATCKDLWCEVASDEVLPVPQIAGQDVLQAGGQAAVAIFGRHDQVCARDCFGGLRCDTCRVAVTGTRACAAAQDCHHNRTGQATIKAL